MNRNEISLNKKLAKLNGIRGLVFAAGLLTLMGCGRNVSNDPVDPTPTQTIETTIDEDEVVIPEVDVPEEEVVETPELPEPTFTQTGNNQYTVAIDCPDNSNAEELQTTYDMVEDFSAVAENNGVSSNLVCAVMTNAVIKNNGILSYGDFAPYSNTVVNTHSFNFNMDMSMVLTDNPSSYNDVSVVYSFDDNDPIGYEAMVGAFLRDSFINTNYNFTCALGRYAVGPEAWEQMMKECMDATGLSAEEIYANYDADFVMSYDTLGLANSEYVNDIVSLISAEDETYVMKDAGNGEYVQTTYNIERTKSLGSR